MDAKISALKKNDNLSLTNKWTPLPKNEGKQKTRTSTTIYFLILLSNNQLETPFPRENISESLNGVVLRCKILSQFIDFPPEIINAVTVFVNYKQMKHLGQTYRQLNGIIGDPKDKLLKKISIILHNIYTET